MVALPEWVTVMVFVVDAGEMLHIGAAPGCAPDIPVPAGNDCVTLSGVWVSVGGLSVKGV